MSCSNSRIWRRDFSKPYRQEEWRGFQPSSDLALALDAGAQAGTLRQPNQHAQAETVDLAVLDLGHPRLGDAEVLGRFALRQS